MNVLAVIIARSGSKGLPKKNLLKLGNQTLIELSIDVAKKAKLVNRIIFSSDSDKYINLAKNRGAEVPFVRPKKLAGDKVSSWEVVRHAVEWLVKNENWKADIIVLLQPNTPFRKPQHIDLVIKKILKGKYCAAMTIREVDYPTEWMFFLNKSKSLIPILKDRKKIKRRQDSKKVYQPAGTAYAINFDRLKLQDPINYDNLGSVIVPFEESINIDSIKDFIIALSYWKLKNGQSI